MDPRWPVSRLMHLHLPSHRGFFLDPPPPHPRWCSTYRLFGLDVHPFSIFALLPTESMEIAFCCLVYAGRAPVRWGKGAQK